MAESLGIAVLDLTTRDAGLTSGLAAAQAKSLKSLKSWERAGSKMTRQLTLPIVAAGGASVVMASKFNESMEQMIALSGISRKQVEEWSTDVLRMAPKLGKAPDELARALYFITSSGVDASKALDVLEISAKASAIGLGETEVVADAITSAMNSYASSNLTAAEAADILAATVEKGKGEASAMAPVLGALLPLASELGVGFEEVGGSIAQMTTLGMPAAEAGTALQAVMSGLLKPSVDANDALSSVGLSAGGLRDQLAKKGVLSVLDTLNEKFDGNTDAIARVFPNIRALRGALALAGKAGGNSASIFEDVKNSTGKLDKAFAEVSKGSAFKFQQGLAQLKVTAITFGNALMPVVLSVASALSRVAAAFSELPPGMQKAIIVALAVAAALGPVITVIVNIIKVVKALSIAMAFLSANPAVLLLVAFVALVAAIIILYRNSEKFRSAVQAMGRALLTAFNAVKTAVIAVRQAIVTAFNSVLSWLRSNWRTIALIISGPFAPLVALATNAFGIRSALIAAFNAVRAAVTAAMRAVIGAVRGAVGAVTGAAKAIGRGIVNGVRTAVNGLSALRGWLWAKVSSGIASVAASAAAGAAAIGRAIVQGVWSGIQSMAGWLQSKISSWASGLMDGAMGALGIKSPSKVAADKLGKPIAQGVEMGIKKNGKKVQATLTNVVKAAINDAKQALTGMAASVGDTLGAAIDESTRRKLAVYDNGPTGQLVKKLNEQLEAEATAKQKADLEAAIANAETEEERLEAVAALRTWGMEQERDRLQAELDMEKAKVQEAADARKVALQQGLADLTDQLNRGHMSQAEYTAKVQALIAEQAPEYRSLGSLLGESQARGYIDTYNAMLAQAGMVLKFGPQPGSGVDLGITDPRVAAKEELQEILKKLMGRATSKSSPGGTKIIASELTAINAIKARIKALGLESGGMISGTLGRDTAGLFALSHGEGVFRRSAMEGMQQWFEKGGASGGVQITFAGPVIGAGDTRSLARELARIVQPELDRRVKL